MPTYVWRKGKMVDKRRAPPREGSYIISDIMPALKHHGTGEIIDSKSRFRQATRACGAVEIGDEPIKPRAKIPLDRRQRREDIARAIYNLRNGIE